jgi:hypothetical protein
MKSRYAVGELNASCRTQFVVGQRSVSRDLRWPFEQCVRVRLAKHQVSLEEV